MLPLPKLSLNMLFLIFQALGRDYIGDMDHGLSELLWLCSLNMDITQIWSNWLNMWVFKIIYSPNYTYINSHACIVRADSVIWFYHTIQMCCWTYQRYIIQKRHIECFRLSHLELSPWSMFKVFKIGDEYSTQQDNVATRVHIPL